jgi:predicted HicB family RNase H-like nuclease
MTVHRKKELTKQLVVRVDEDLYDALARDAEANGRTVAQTVRFKLRTLAMT